MMKPSRALCISRDDKVRRAVAEALASTGLRIHYSDDVGAGHGDPLAIVFVDRAIRVSSGDHLRTLGAPVVVVGDDLDDDRLITLMLERPVSHLVSDPEDRDLSITSEKLASGDLFGLEKYLAAGTPVCERAIHSELAKRRVMDEVCAWAELIGARRPVLHRLANVVDELLMNALRDVEGTGTSCASIVRWATDDRVLAISVTDSHGALSQREVIDHVLRARTERGRPRTSSEANRGAGLGLYLVLANVASLIVNVAPGKRTEVVCLFDLAKRSQRGVRSGVRALHVFAGS
ncbi:MAG: ATP-binding protein [Kofleriaceae bacterium]